MKGCCPSGVTNLNEGFLAVGLWQLGDKKNRGRGEFGKRGGKFPPTSEGLGAFARTKLRRYGVEGKEGGVLSPRASKREKKVFFFVCPESRHGSQNCG